MNPSYRKVIARAAPYADMALSIPISALVGYWLGYALDNWLGTTWIRVAGLLLLMIGAFVRMVVYILREKK